MHAVVFIIHLMQVSYVRRIFIVYINGHTDQQQIFSYVKRIKNL